MSEQLNLALAAAVSRNQDTEIPRLLAEGADINMLTADGETLIVDAMSNGYYSMLDLLLKLGANVNQKTDSGITPLMRAAGISNIANGVNVTRKLLEYGADPNLDSGGDYCLDHAVWNNCSQRVKLLLDAGADVNAISNTGTPIMHMRDLWSADIMEILLDHGADIDMLINPPQLQGPTKKEDKVVRTFPIKLEGVPHAEQFTVGDAAMIRAAQGGNLGVLKRLFNRKVDVNVRDSFGATALLRAAEDGQVEAVKLLLANGADYNLASNSDTTPLLAVAADRSNTSDAIIRILVQNGADINYRNRDGQTPLLTAIDNINATHVRTLVELGADIEIKNNNMELPLDVAYRKNKPSLFQASDKWIKDIVATLEQRTLMQVAADTENPVEPSGSAVTKSVRVRL